MTSLSTRPRERRRHARTPVSVAVRVCFAGRTLPVTVELADVSESGCYFRGARAPGRVKAAFGLILPGRGVYVARGRVVRLERTGFAMQIARASAALTEIVTALSAAA
jgi:hypothetical protein